MKTMDVYRQYFAAVCTFNGVERRGADVWLTAESDSGIIRYEVGVTFFPTGMRKILLSATMPAEQRNCFAPRDGAPKNGMGSLWRRYGRRPMRSPHPLAASSAGMRPSGMPGTADPVNEHTA